MKHKGFTLIELMIVVALIGILAAIALPAYQQYIEQQNPNAIVRDQVSNDYCERACVAHYSTKYNLSVGISQDVCAQAMSPPNRCIHVPKITESKWKRYDFSMTGGPEAKYGILIQHRKPKQGDES